MVICLERDADLHMAQLMPLPLTVSWFSKIQIGFTQWCIAKNGGGYTQRGVAKGLKVPCLFMIAEVSICCQKNPGGWHTPYTRVYPKKNTTGFTFLVPAYPSSPGKRAVKQVCMCILYVTL